MGIYVFNADTLQTILRGSNGSRPMDFGKDVIPQMIETHRVYAYPFAGYWVDVGTVQSYWETNMDLLGEAPQLDLYNPDWTIHTRSEERPPVRLGAEADMDRGLLSNGCLIDGRIERSVLSPGVVVEAGAVVRDSILFSDAVVKAGAVVDRVIMDKGAVIGAGTVVGEGDLDVPNRDFPDRVNTGITLIGKNAHVAPNIRVGRNVLIRPDRQVSDFAGDVESGSTV
jgi:glucose-1-phosphate adenylyltransferase